MKIFQTPSYDRFCLFEMERKSKDFRGMDDNVAYKNKQIDNVEISNEGRRALREKLREVKPKVEEPIGYELTIQDTNEVEWEHYTSMREYSGLTLKDGKYNLEDVMKSMMDAYETRYNYIVKEHENGERQVSYNLTGENSLTLDEDLAVEGVTDATVSFMTQKMKVEFADGSDEKAVMENVVKACKRVEDDCEIYL